MTSNEYINQLASSLSESVLGLAKVGYADQFITNGVEAYRGGEEIARKVADLFPVFERIIMSLRPILMIRAGRS